MYTLLIHLYGAAMRLAATFHPKANDWVVGRRNVWADIEKLKSDARPVFWLHAASLGEFEQGRPILEAWRTQYGDTHKIVVTFFSPSGYTIRKNYPLADVVTYLPLDTPENARRFIQIVRPTTVVFVKYEFWYHILTETFKTKADVYLVSASFRPQQFLFKWYGASFLDLLHGFRQIFVQKPEHLAILQQYNVKNAQVAGDTRLDRSVQVAKKTPSLPLIQHFIQGRTTLIAGSTWQPDENVLLPITQNSQFSDWCFILAPHEIKTANIKALQQRFGTNTILYSELVAQNGAESTKNILIIDNIGLLAALFKYANYAYIGGAFGSGLHNIIEAAVFGVPIFFGCKNYKKFPESTDLIHENGAFAISESQELSEKLAFFTKNNTAYLSACANNKRYVLENAGATEQILAVLKAYNAS